jgi:hypothetical protein
MLSLAAASPREWEPWGMSKPIVFPQYDLDAAGRLDDIVPTPSLRRFENLSSQIRWVIRIAGNRRAAIAVRRDDQATADAAIRAGGPYSRRA